MIDNLRGLAAAFTRHLHLANSQNVTALAERLCHADMGAAAAQYWLPESHHEIVREAKRWLRDQEALDALEPPVYAV